MLAVVASKVETATCSVCCRPGGHECRIFPMKIHNLLSNFIIKYVLPPICLAPPEATPFSRMASLAARKTFGCLLLSLSSCLRVVSLILVVLVVVVVVVVVVISSIVIVTMKMCMYVHIYIYIYCTHTYTYIYIYIHTCICIRIYIYIYMLFDDYYNYYMCVAGQVAALEGFSQFSHCWVPATRPPPNIHIYIYRERER